MAGEAAALRAEEERLANADALHAGATVAHEALLGDPTAAIDGADAMTLLGQARRALEAVRRHDAEIDGVAARLSEAAYLVSEVAGELASYIQSIDADPARLAAVQERRAALNRLVRVYGPGGVSPYLDLPPAGRGRHPAEEPDEIAAVLDWARRAAVRVTELDTDDDKIATLTDEEAALPAQVTELAARLSGLRARGGRAVRRRRDGRADRSRHAARQDLGRSSARWTSRRCTASTTWRSGWPRTRARPRCRCTRAPPAASCPG